MLMRFLVEPRKSDLLLALSVLSLLVVLCLPVDGAAQRARKPAGSANPTSRATGALKVITGQAGSVIFINTIRHGVTTDKGEVDLPRIHTAAATSGAGGGVAVAERLAVTTQLDHGSVVIAAGASRTLKVTQQPTTDETTLHYQKGEALRDSGKNKDAVQEYQQALTARPAFTEARIGMARCFVTLQDYQEAEKQTQAAIKAGGRTLVEAQTVLANLRRHQGLSEEAIFEYRKAIKLAAGNAFEAHIGLAIALDEAGKTDEAVKEYRIGIMQDMETEPILYYQLGEILEKAGRNKEAIEAYRNYVRLDPEGEYASAVESVIEQLKQGPDKKEP